MSVGEVSVVTEGRRHCCSTVADVNPTSKLDDMHQCYAYITYGEFSFLVLRARASSPARCMKQKAE